MSELPQALKRLRDQDDIGDKYFVDVWCAWDAAINATWKILEPSIKALEEIEVDTRNNSAGECEKCGPVIVQCRECGDTNDRASQALGNLATSGEEQEI